MKFSRIAISNISNRKISTEIIFFSFSRYKTFRKYYTPYPHTRNILSNIFLASKDRTYFRAIRKYQRFRQTYRA